MARNTNPRKQILTYCFSVEGETEKWYLDWLEAQINLQEETKFKVKLKAEVQKGPVSYTKKLTVQRRTTVWHLSDIEGSTPSHIQSIENTLGRLKDAKNLGKDITYHWGYSNLSFDLWMILHKTVSHHIPVAFYGTQRQCIEYPDRYEKAVLSDMPLICMLFQKLL